MLDSILIDTIDVLISALVAILTTIGWRKRQEHKEKLAFKTKLEADARRWQKEIQNIYPFLHSRYDVILGLQSVDPIMDRTIEALKEMIDHRHELIARSETRLKSQAGLVIDQFEATTKKLFQHQYNVDDLDIWFRGDQKTDPLTDPTIDQLLRLLKRL